MARKSSWTHLYLLLIRVSDVCVCVCDGFSFCFTVNRGDVTGESPSVPPPLSAMLQVSGTRIPHRLGVRFQTQAHTRCTHTHTHANLAQLTYSILYMYKSYTFRNG